jgi:high-affinity iron transporter
LGASFILTLREGIEAALIVSIILAYLRKLGRSDRVPLVWWGTLAAAALSVLVGAIVFTVAGEFEGRAAEIFEGLVSLVAVGFLTWMIFWMRRQAARIKSELHEKVDAALVGSGIGLATLAFAMVFREGIETALFLFGIAKATAEGTGGAWGQVLGAALGLGTAVTLGYLLYRGGIRLNLRTFFRVTGGLLLVVAAGLLAYAVHEFQEAGYLGFLTGAAYDLSGALPDGEGVGAILRGLIGYQDEPSVLEALVWGGYLAVAGFFFFRPAPASVPTVAARTPEAEPRRVG